LQGIPSNTFQTLAKEVVGTLELLMTEADLEAGDGEGADGVAAVAEGSVVEVGHAVVDVVQLALVDAVDAAEGAAGVDGAAADDATMEGATVDGATVDDAAADGAAMVAKARVAEAVMDDDLTRTAWAVQLVSWPSSSWRGSRKSRACGMVRAPRKR
jgi:hypothetical protein